MGDKTKEQLLEELSEIQNVLEKRTEMQGQMIKNYKMLIANEGLFTQIIDFFPYPIAIFTSHYILTMVNRAFTEETKIQVIDPEKDNPKILLYKIDDMQLATAVTQVFNGETIFLEDLKNPFSMFSSMTQLHPNPFNKAVIFPIPTDDAVITHGVIVFMS